MCHFIILCMAFCNFFSKKQIMIYKKGYLFLLIDIEHALCNIPTVSLGYFETLGNRQAWSASGACWEDEGWLGCSVDWICRHYMWYYHIYMLHVLYWLKTFNNKFNNKNEPKSTCKWTIVLIIDIFDDDFVEFYIHWTCHLLKIKIYSDDLEFHDFVLVFFCDTCIYKTLPNNMNQSFSRSCDKRLSILLLDLLHVNVILFHLLFVVLNSEVNSSLEKKNLFEMFWF